MEKSWVKMGRCRGWRKIKCFMEFKKSICVSHWLRTDDENPKFPLERKLTDQRFTGFIYLFKSSFDITQNSIDKLKEDEYKEKFLGFGFAQRKKMSIERRRNRGSWNEIIKTKLIDRSKGWDWLWRSGSVSMGSKRRDEVVEEMFHQSSVAPMLLRLGQTSNEPWSPSPLVCCLIVWFDKKQMKPNRKPNMSDVY